jgi:hypothetical protein
MNLNHTIKIQVTMQQMLLVPVTYLTNPMINNATTLAQVQHQMSVATAAFASLNDECKRV